MCASLARHQIRPQNSQPEACSFPMAQPLSAQGLAEVLRSDKTLGNFFLKLGTGHLCNKRMYLMLIRTDWNLATEGVIGSLFILSTIPK